MAITKKGRKKKKITFENGIQEVLKYLRTNKNLTVGDCIGRKCFQFGELFLTLFLKFKVPFHLVDVFNGYSF